MAEEVKATTEKDITINDGKTPEVEIQKETTVAPVEDQTMDNEAPDEEDFERILSLLNSLDTEIGGTGGITELPEATRGVMRFMVEKMEFLRDLFEDPSWKALLDDLADQKEDGEIPSVAVAVARTMPLDQIQELADNEDYAGAQSELAGKLESNAKSAEADAEFEAKFVRMQEAGQEYAAEMGYDEEETNMLLQFALDLFQVMGDGEITKDEWSKVDKMRNYDKDTEDLRSQISSQDAKEVLPDQASVEAAMVPKTTRKQPVKNDPGIGSMIASDFGVDVTSIGKRKRGK